MKKSYFLYPNVKSRASVWTKQVDVVSKLVGNQNDDVPCKANRMIHFERNNLISVSQHLDAADKKRHKAQPLNLIYYQSLYCRHLREFNSLLLFPRRMYSTKNNCQATCK